MTKLLLARCCTILMLLCSFNVAHAQIIKDPTSWTYEVKKKGDNKYDLIFKLKLAEHWHIWSLNPGGDGLQIVPSFTFKKNPAFKLLGKVSEAGDRKTENMDGVDGAVSYFLNTVQYTQSVSVTGNTKISGTHEYQVCDETQCLAPKRKDFSFDITDAASVVDSAVTAPTVAADSTMDTTSTFVLDKATSTPAADTAANAASGDINKEVPESMWLIFLAGLGAGLAAVVTPCIYSMIPITVSFFTKKSKSRKQGIVNALVYSTSIIVIFAALGMLIIGVFGANALNNLSTNWIPNLIFFAIFLLFGFSFLGAFELTLPASWTNKVDSKAGVNSYSGIFFMALTLVIVSFSCTSAFIGGIAVLASKGGFWGPLVGFASFGLGIALPFTGFALFPSYLKNLEKPGGWQNAVKVTLGFLELGLALKFLSNADLAKGWRLLDREIFIAVWVVLAILLGMYLLGKLRFSHDDDLPKNMFGIPYVSVPRLLLAVSAFSFSVYLIPGMWGAPLKAVSAFVPPMGTQDFVVGEGGGHANAAADNGLKPMKYADKLKIYEPEVVRKFGLQTYFDLDEAKAASKALHKPLMLDFTGINCVNCRKMEGQVWSDPEIMKMLKEDFIIVSLFCDFDSEMLPENEQYESKILGSKVQTLGDKNEDYQATQFNSNTQPYYFFIDENDARLATGGYQYNPDVKKFKQHLQNVTEQYKRLHP